MKRTIFNSLRLLLIISLCLSCSHNKKHWELAKSLNTIDSYREFYFNHSTSEYADSAKTKIVLEPVGWETHSSPEMGDRAQEIINKVQQQLIRIVNI